MASEPKLPTSKFLTNKYSEDLWSIFVGDHIGSGVYRDVYECKIDDTLVLKVENGNSFCNVREWTVWDSLTESRWTDWLAPCEAISDCGKFLLQKRTKPILNRPLPDKIPNFLDDTHMWNWGIYEDRLVCYDYGFTRFIPDFKPRMIKHKWEN